jgi:hypothetical protein
MYIPTYDTDRHYKPRTDTFSKNGFGNKMCILRGPAFVYFNHRGIDHQIGSIMKIPQELKPMAETSYIKLINFLYPT